MSAYALLIKPANASGRNSRFRSTFTNARRCVPIAFDSRMCAARGLNGCAKRSRPIQIAREVRARDGGLPFVKALGFDLHSRGVVQVSMNLIDYERTGIARAFTEVREAAARHQVEVLSTEIVGLVPRAALDPEAAYFPL